MKIITNTKLIQRNAKIARYSFFISMGILAIGLYISFKYPNDTQMLSWMMVTLLVGFLLSQISVYFQNRWGKSPRPDEQITAALKGLDNGFALLHYRSPASHLLIGPGGIWGIIPYSQSGTISYEKNHWKQRGGSFLMKIFGGEGIGRPEQEAATVQKDIRKALVKEFDEATLPPIKIVMVFTDPKVKLQVEDAPIPALAIDKLKEFMRKNKKTDVLPQEEADKYTEYFETSY
jgi:hypothetical protein